MRRLFIAVSVFALVMAAVGPAAAKSPKGGEALRFDDNLSSPLGDAQAELKQAAREAVLKGEAKAKGDNKVVQLGKKKFVELAFEGEDQILTLLGQFGNGQDNTHDGRRSHAPHGGTNGPLHNEIPEPDRSVDNTTIWAPDFNQSYYDTLLYDQGANPSMANWYLEQSSGRYTVDGFVGDWVTVPDNGATYGSNYCGSIVCQDTWFFVEDQANFWWNDLVAANGGSVAAANAFLATFDVWDRYDWNGNGNFDEPDGYIDHFQSVHAGIGEETCSPNCNNAIWSHRWYVQLTPIGAGGPHNFGGTRIGASNYWIGDYTIEPENGGVGVFSHEFAHDLGLPDEYDTSGNTGGAENSTAWWTIMSQGSYGTVTDDLGSAPVHFNAWDKFQLGFLNEPGSGAPGASYEVAFAGDSGKFKLGPAEYNSNNPQAMFIVLPDVEVTREIGAPYEGTSFYYSGTADDLNTTMTRSMTLPAGAVSLAAKVRYNIEVGFDYAYLMVNGTKITTNLSNSTVTPTGIDGVAANWVDLTANLSAYAGQTVTLGFGYFTDGGVQGQNPALPAGFALDNLVITGQALDGGNPDPGWTYATNTEGTGFHVTTGTETFEFFNAYVLESRNYVGYDYALKTGPYNFTSLTFVEHFKYQDGLLIWYWNDAYSDNNVGDHPGSGLILPVDSHPGIQTWKDGTQMRPRIQSYDSTFTTHRTDAIKLHNPADGVEQKIKSMKGVRVFDDSMSWWTSGHPSDAAGGGRYQAEWNSVNVPNTGTVVRVKSINHDGVVRLELNP